MRKLDSFKAKARALARSGYFYGLPPLEFELSFEEGFHEAREWLELASTREELEHLKPRNLGCRRLGGASDLCLSCANRQKGGSLAPEPQ